MQAEGGRSRGRRRCQKEGFAGPRLETSTYLPNTGPGRAGRSACGAPRRSPRVSGVLGLQRHTRVHAHTHTHTRAHTQAHTHAQTHTHAHMHARTHAQTQAHTRTHRRTHTCTHAHAHTRAHRRTDTHVFGPTGAAAGRNGRKKRPSPTPALSTVTTENNSPGRDTKVKLRCQPRTVRKLGQVYRGAGIIDFSSGFRERCRNQCSTEVGPSNL